MQLYACHSRYPILHNYGFLSDFSPLSLSFSALDPTVIVGITGGKTAGAEGCSVSGLNTSGFEAALAIVEQSDYVILMLGLDLSIEVRTMTLCFVFSQVY